MFDLEELLAVAYKKERMRSRRLAKGASMPEHDALLRTLEKAAAPNTLAELIEARRDAQMRAADAQRQRETRRAERNARPSRTDERHDGQSWTGWFDGSAQPNPGRIGIGGVLRSPDGAIFEISEAAGHGDSSAAEYLALIALLETARREGARDVSIYGDSRVVIDDLLAADDTGIRSLTHHAKRARAHIEAIGAVRLQWLPRERNVLADELSRRALTTTS